MTRRTDIHRPSAIMPADYDFVGYNYLPAQGGVEGLSFVISQRALIRAHMDRTGGRYSTHEHAGNCHVCGAHCMYMATFHHRATNVYIRTGLDCADNMDLRDADAFRRQVRDSLEARAGVRKAAALCDEHGVSRAYDYFNRARRPIMDEGEALIPETFAQYEERTIIDIVGKLAKYGSISDRQWNFVRALLAKIDNRANVAATAAATAATRAQELADASPVPTSDDRMTVVGEVISTRQEERTFGYRRAVVTKMLVKHADGWKVWGTMPSNLEAQRGDKVEFTALVTRSDRDEKFGFFARPTNARILASA